MEKFETLTAIACPLGLENIDTDQLIPARFMSRSRAQGYGSFLFHDLRFDEVSAPKGFLIDKARYAHAQIIVARRNFGTGSSREAAVYALADFGIRCIIAPSFGDIFLSNATKNGVLCATVAAADAEAILECLEKTHMPSLMIDLQRQIICDDAHEWSFSIDSVRRLQLLNGWDDLDITRQYQQEIDRFFVRRHHTFTWALPTGNHARNA